MIEVLIALELAFLAYKLLQDEYGSVIIKFIFSFYENNRCINSLDVSKDDQSGL